MKKIWLSQKQIVIQTHKSFLNDKFSSYKNPNLKDFLGTRSLIKYTTFNVNMIRLKYVSNCRISRLGTELER